MKKYRVAVVGAGAVGVQMVRILNQRKFPVEELRVLARSARTLDIDGRSYAVKETTAEAFDGVDIALFAGTEGEKGAAVTFGAEAVKRGAVVIDNGSDFRMKDDVPLVIPELNADALKNHKGIIANPNCTTAIILMGLGPLHKAFGVTRAVISTYQAVSGAGAKGVEGLRKQTEAALKGQTVSDLNGFPNPIAFNVLANNWAIEEEGYSNEEWKVVKETHKILGDDSIRVAVTTVRVPTYVGHGESVWIETKKPITPEAARAVFAAAPGVRVVDEASPLEGVNCPMPLLAEGKDDSLVGRIRRDLFSDHALAFWVVGDNLRKGAALNAVQIAETLAARGWLKPSVPAGR
ncbi:MAG TPA: aspartate-semialdehyde dehydrogenase [Elusimicrobiota bacterium]|nr:aspartate-semialdehyde dehydrogenase [Elusimicrobiota bacterium]HNA60016.1 aspartate-semialdehyde dehydrogenase [Elusimicrobiota bacterium]